MARSIATENARANATEITTFLCDKSRADLASMCLEVSLAQSMFFVETLNPAAQNNRPIDASQKVFAPFG